MLDFGETEKNSQERHCLILKLIEYPDCYVPNIVGLHDDVYAVATDEVKRFISDSVTGSVRRAAPGLFIENHQNKWFYRMGVEL